MFVDEIQYIVNVLIVFLLTVLTLESYILRYSILYFVYCIEYGIIDRITLYNSFYCVCICFINMYYM